MGHAADFWPEVGSGGRPIESSPEEVDFALWCLVQAGGSPTRAARMVEEQRPGTGINRDHIWRWAGGRFKPRYDELRRERAGDLDDQIAANAYDIAVQLGHAEDLALKRALAGLADANGVEASMILRNFTQSKATQIEKAGQLRGNRMFGPAQIDLTMIAAEIEQLGVSRRRDVESTADEVAELDAP